MDAGRLAEGDALCRRLVSEYWPLLEEGNAWNYFGWSPKYVPSDTWATRSQWIDFARACLAKDKAGINAHQILLDAGCEGALAPAREFVDEWHRRSAHDPEYYWKILSYLPEEDPLRQEYLGFPPDQLDDPESDISTAPDTSIRSVLMSAGDSRMCRFVAERVTEIFAAEVLDDERAEDYALPRMVELGPRCAEYLSAETIARAREFCLRLLEKDREVSPRREALFEAGEVRCLWLRCDIAYVCHRIGFDDIMQKLRSEDWYWNSMFDSYCESENYTLLTWSLSEKDDVLLERTEHVMTTDAYARVEGAIAWSRMRGI